MMISRMQCESMSSPNVMLAISDPRRPKVAEAAAAITLRAHQIVYYYSLGRYVWFFFSYELIIRLLHIAHRLMCVGGGIIEYMVGARVFYKQ